MISIQNYILYKKKKKRNKKYIIFVEKRMLSETHTQKTVSA